jgi:hypothetical protein
VLDHSRNDEPAPTQCGVRARIPSATTTCTPWIFTFLGECLAAAAFTFTPAGTPS